MVVGLTGNIGCGKSSLSNTFKSNNIPVIDADIVSRHIFEDKNLLEALFEVFGSNIKNTDKTLNRKKLGEIVFNDSEKLVILNNLTHPVIKANIKEKIEKLKKQDEKIIVVDAALLIEGNFLDIIDKLIVITCDLEIQAQRIIKRDNITKEQAKKRIDAQMNQDEKIKYGDYIIDNSKTLIELEQNSVKLISYMKENWCD